MKLIMTFLFFSLLNSNKMDQTYSAPLARLHAGEITHLQFLTEANCGEDFKKWCDEHALEENEDNAQFYFDSLGFEDTEIVKEFVEPVL